MAQDNFSPQASGEDSNDPLSNLGGFSKSGFDKSSLVMIQINRVVLVRSKEMTRGYTTTKFDNNGNAMPVTIPDARKEFISSIKALKSLLAPEAEDEKEQIFIEKEKEIMGRLKKCYERYCYSPYILKTVGIDHFGNKDERYFEDKDNKYMPSPGSTVSLPNGPVATALTPVERGWDSNIHLYIDETVSLYDELFAELNKLVKRLGYYKKKMRITG